MALIECEECGHQVSNKAQECPKCGAPVSGTDVGPSIDEERQRAEVLTRAKEEAKQEIEAEQNAKAQKLVKEGCLGCLGLPVALIVALVVIGSLLPKAESDHRSMAVVQCKNYVKNRLRSPSSADFPWIDLDQSVVSTGNETYIVSSYVDAQNAFGATVRNDYVCKIQYTGGERTDQRNWPLVDLSLEPR